MMDDKKIKPKILIVEDECITAMDIQNCLQNFGYNVPAIADSGEEAIALAETLKPDLILMDIILKGEMDGTAAAKYISCRHQIPIIFLTAFSDEMSLQRAAMSAPYGYVTKPFEAQDLHIAVTMALTKRNLEKKLAVETERLKNEFLTNMTHEIRTPLGGMIGFLELIYYEKVGSLTGEQKDILQEIIQSSHSLLRLLSDILDLTKAQSNTMQFYPAPIDLVQLLNEVKEANQKKILNKKIELILEIAPSLMNIIVDPDKLKSVINHFLSNAIKFSKENSTVIISAILEGNDQFRIEVRDSGIGIKMEDMINLFVPFRQLNMGMSKEFQGAGVGLTLVKKIVEAQGGNVGVNSEYEKGSTFYIILPIKPKAKIKKKKEPIHN
jgi:signal transduction histidine kinase